MSRVGGRDALGLRGAAGTRGLPLLVGAMAFLACLAGGGLVGARALAAHWQGGAAAVLMAQVPDGESAADDGRTRLQVATALLAGDPRVAEARALSPDETSALLRPWLGGAAVPTDLALPTMIRLRLAPGAAPDHDAARELGVRLAAAVPGATIDDPADWSATLARLAASLQGCAAVVLAVVGAVAAISVAAATRGGLASRHDAVVMAHGLGATNAYIADHFARRATLLASGGALLGSLASIPMLAALARLAAPLVASQGEAAPPSAAAAWWPALPAELWLGLCALPLLAAGIGFVTAQATVRQWLRRLP